MAPDKGPDVMYSMGFSYGVGLIWLIPALGLNVACSFSLCWWGLGLFFQGPQRGGIVAIFSESLLRVAGKLPSRVVLVKERGVNYGLEHRHSRHTDDESLLLFTFLHVCDPEWSHTHVEQCVCH